MIAIVFLILAVLMGLIIHVCKLIYKVSYYESRLERIGFNISHVKNKSFLSMLLE